MGKGLRRVGVKLVDLLNRVPIPQKHFRWKYSWNESFIFFVLSVLSDILIL